MGSEKCVLLMCVCVSLLQSRWLISPCGLGISPCSGNFQVWMDSKLWNCWDTAFFVCVEINPQMNKMSGSGHNKNVSNEVLLKSANMFSHFLYWWNTFLSGEQYLKGGCKAGIFKLSSLKLSVLWNTRNTLVQGQSWELTLHSPYSL